MANLANRQKETQINLNILFFWLFTQNSTHSNFVIYSHYPAGGSNVWGRRTVTRIYDETWWEPSRNDGRWNWSHRNEFIGMYQQTHLAKIRNIHFTLLLLSADEIYYITNFISVHVIMITWCTIFAIKKTKNEAYFVFIFVYRKNSQKSVTSIWN